MNWYFKYLIWKKFSVIYKVPLYQPPVPQAQLYQVFIPHGYAYDPVVFLFNFKGYYNQYMNSQTASHQHVFQAPTHVYIINNILNIIYYSHIFVYEFN